MDDGRDRTDIPFRWPLQLVFEHPKPVTVYLDLNFWIGLAQASVGHPQGSRHKPLLERALLLVQQQEVLFPLSGHHYMEMSAISDPRQRTDIANVMRDLSGYRTLINLPLLMEMEVQAGIDHILGCGSGLPEPIHAIGTGFGHAFGIVGNFKITDDRNDGDARARFPGGPHAFDEAQAKVQSEGEWTMLRGPSDDELEQLSDTGYDPKVAQTSFTKRAEQELEHVAQLNDEPEWRRGRLRDVMRGRYLSFELLDFVGRHLTLRNRTAEDLHLDDAPTAREFIDAMPSGDVRVSLHTECHRNPSSKWQRNDIADFGALSNAVPLCDAVAVDKRRAHELDVSKCAVRHNTCVLTTPAQVIDFLAGVEGN